MDQPRRPSRSGPTASAMVARYAVEAFEARGVDCGPILARLGVRRELLRDPDARIPLAAYDGLWREAVLASGDPLTAVAVGRQLPLAAFRIVGYSVATAANLREALATFGRYFALLKGGFVFELRRRGEDEWVEYRGAEPQVTLPPEVAVAGTAAIVSMAEEVTRQPLRIQEIRFPFPEPPHARRLAEAFDTRLSFGADGVEVWPVARALDAPIAAHDPTLRATFEQLARQALEGDRRAREYADALSALERTLARARDALEEPPPAARSPRR